MHFVHWNVGKMEEGIGQIPSPPAAPSWLTDICSYWQNQRQILSLERSSSVQTLRWAFLCWACVLQYLPVSSSHPWRHRFVSVQSVHEGTPDSCNGSTDIRLLLFFCTPRSTALAVCCSSLANKANFYSKNGSRLLQSWATHTHPTHY